MKKSKKKCFYNGVSVYNVEKNNNVCFIAINRRYFPYFTIIEDKTTKKQYELYVKRQRKKQSFVTSFYNKKGNVNSINTAMSDATKLLYDYSNSRTLKSRTLDYFNKHKYTTKIYTLNELASFRK